MRYSIAHETVYDYADAVSLSQQLLHLTPRQVERPSVIEHRLSISPTPVHRFDRHDSFGNPVTALEFDRPHRQLKIAAHTLIEVAARAQRLDLDASPAWETVAQNLGYGAGRNYNEASLQATMYRVESPFVRVKRALGDYARDCFPKGRPLLAAADALMHKINREFTFDADATQIATPMLEVLEKKRGVCQDYAHIMLGCLRSLGLPARYMSGYLLTHPPPGKPRLVGADASHAWVSAWCPVNGWIEFDPTNKVIPDTEHIAIAWGRDFGDVSPQRGIILGGGSHKIKVGVTVTPL
ncbi:MAG: transglutaminase family protein [Rhodanobacteraceae bacterium]|nr:transglutaminase family protein [Rhodanobacteraceae bacterium]